MRVGERWGLDVLAERELRYWLEVDTVVERRDPRPPAVPRARRADQGATTHQVLRLDGLLGEHKVGLKRLREPTPRRWMRFAAEPSVHVPSDDPHLATLRIPDSIPRGRGPLPPLTRRLRVTWVPSRGGIGAEAPTATYGRMLLSPHDGRKGGEHMAKHTLRGGDEIPDGTFHGGDEIPDGTFHGGDEIPPGTFH